MKRSIVGAVFLMMCFISTAVLAQLPVSLTLPQASPKETRSITIGFTTISFEYNSVGIKDREIWGGLVPYGEVWRTGANKNTLFTVTDDVLINGQKLKAGSYGMHTIPGEEEWVIIFSNFSEAWGSYFYDENEDALRITVTPEEMDSKYEWMKFSFSDYTNTSVDISLKWAHLKVPFKVEIPMETTFVHIENQFRTLPAFSWQGWVQGATYLQNNDYKPDVALQWAARALEIDRSVQTLGLHAKLLILNGKKDEGLKEAAEMRNEWSDDWRAHYSAAEVYEEAEELKKAEEAYKQAKELASDDRTKQVLQRRIDSLKEK
ncbi:MAG: DUF2911 domain-containing protein [Balneola sp.]|nr:DUF2911 domain-containing protein [Balneola sp.]MBO6652228.1 DUF2911 domain-containing protein [Balneola sp.]MBO6709951.1 DUF2911 domain-containing protein [Balneola sp.]MBO6798635.1 DUF2911 domain-containing protein [Balneola sp.]MBO6871894.1 DUF2911 domain-containing protein [Balneola sp.]